MALYLNRQEIASYQGQPKNVPTTKPTPSSKDKKKLETVTVKQDAKKVEKLKPISAMHKMETVTTNPGTNAVIPADHIPSSENIPSTETGENSFGVDSAIKDKLLGMQISPTKLSKAEFETLKESCKSDSAKNSLIKDMSYEQYQEESKEFADDLKAGLASGHTISFKEMVLFGGNHYTRQAWDAVSGSKQDGEVDDDDQLDLNDLDKNFELVANYETMHGTGSYTGQTKFVVVDISEINAKAQVDGKTLEQLTSSDIEKIALHLKIDKNSMGKVHEKWRRVLLYLTFARTLGEAAVKDSNLQFDYVNTKLADMLGGKAIEVAGKDIPASEKKAPAGAAKKTSKLSPEDEAKGQLIKVSQLMSSGVFKGTPAQIANVREQLEGLKAYADSNPDAGPLKMIDGNTRQPIDIDINQFIEEKEAILVEHEVRNESNAKKTAPAKDDVHAEPANPEAGEQMTEVAKDAPVTAKKSDFSKEIKADTNFKELNSNFLRAQAYISAGNEEEANSHLSKANEAYKALLKSQEVTDAQKSFFDKKLATYQTVLEFMKKSKQYTQERNALVQNKRISNLKKYEELNDRCIKLSQDYAKFDAGIKDTGIFPGNREKIKGHFAALELNSNYGSFKPENVKKALKFFEDRFNEVGSKDPDEAQGLASAITELKIRIADLEKEKSKPVAQQAPAKATNPSQPPRSVEKPIKKKETSSLDAKGQVKESKDRGKKNNNAAALPNNGAKSTHSTNAPVKSVNADPSRSKIDEIKRTLKGTPDPSKNWPGVYKLYADKPGYGADMVKTAVTEIKNGK